MGECYARHTVLSQVGTKMNGIDFTGRTEIEDLLPILQRIGFIDVGVITGFANSTGRATVNTFQMLGNKRLELTDVEVLYIGTLMNGFTGDLVNSPCLIIYPRSVVPSLRDQQVLWAQRPYDSAGVKCIPLSTRPDLGRVRVGFDSLGQFIISSKNFVVTISADGIRYSNADNTLQYDISGSADSEQVSGGGYIVTTTSDDGNYEIYYKETSGKVAYRVRYKPDGTYSIQKGAHAEWEDDEKDDHDLFENYAWTTVYSMDGTVDIEQKDADGNPLWHYNITPEGAVDLTQTNADGDVLNHITITAEGDLTIAQEKAENTLTLTQDGNLSITTKADVNVEASGNIGIKTSGNAEVNADGDVKVNAGGAMETITGSTWKAGSSSITLKSILIDDLLNSLLAKFDTVGSPGSHMTGPGATAMITQFAQKWGQLLQ